ncbi:MAG: type II secretion system protein H [Polaribacter sp.]
MKAQGFSLLEILVAMAIMAIMVAFALPNLGGSSDKLAKQEILRLVAAIELVRDQSVLLNREFGLTIDDKGYQFLELVEDDDSDKKSKGKSSGKSKSGAGSSNSSDNSNNDFDENSKDQKRKPKLASWKEISELPELGRHEFNEGLEINLTLDEENLFSQFDDEIDIFEEDVEIFENEEESQKKFEPPQIYFLSSGEQNQFSIGIAILDKSRMDSDSHFFRVRGFLTGELKYEGPLVGNLFQDLDKNYEDNEL